MSYCCCTPQIYCRYCQKTEKPFGAVKPFFKLSDKDNEKFMRDSTHPPVPYVVEPRTAQPEPSPEWMTEEEQTAYTFGWFKALESKRMAQPEQEQNLKLMPREATPEMLKAMDECSTEGYDERLYEGHAGSVYMAAWDAFHGQHCYCGDITNLGVIHRDDGPCHYSEHTSEYKRGYADAMNWKVQNHLEHLPAAQPEQEPVAITITGKLGNIYSFTGDYNLKKGDKVYTTPPQRKPLTDEQVREITKRYALSIAFPYDNPTTPEMFARAIEAAHGIKEQQ